MKMIKQDIDRIIFLLEKNINVSISSGVAVVQELKKMMALLPDSNWFAYPENKPEENTQYLLEVEESDGIKYFDDDYFLKDRWVIYAEETVIRFMELPK